MTRQDILNEAVEELNRIAATVQYQTADKVLAIAILDCADQLAQIAKATNGN